jgi:hypothetical protein
MASGNQGAKALIAVAGLSAALAGRCPASTLWEFKFNETGASPANSGAGSPAPALVTKQAFYGSISDLHGADGSGVSGLAGDRAMDLSGIATNGGMFAGKSAWPQINVANTNCTPIQDLTAFTLSGWFNARAPITRGTYRGDAKLMTFFHYSSAAGGNLGFGVEFSTPDAAKNQMKVVLDAATLFFDVTPIMDFGDTNRWYFWAVAYDGALGSGNARLYMGTPATAVAQVGAAQTANSGAMGTTTTDFSLNGGNGSGTLKGFQDNVRVDNVVLSQAELESRRIADAWPDAGINKTNSIPYSEAFDSYPDGYELPGTNGWSAQYASMGVVTANSYTSSYSGTFPIPGSHQMTLRVDGRVTNSFSNSSLSNAWVDVILESKYWTNSSLPSASMMTNAQFALCITTNSHLAVWNCSSPPAPACEWTELLDTAVPEDSYARVTVQMAYVRDAANNFHFRVWVNGAPSVSPKTWYASANTNWSSLRRITAEGQFQMDDLTVQSVPPFTNVSIVSSSVGQGSILPSGTIQVPYGSAASFTNRPSSWHHVATVAVDGVSIGAPPVYTFTNVTAEHTILAGFAADTVLSNTPAWWLAAANPAWTNDLSAASTNDQDGDGLFTWEEYVTGTDPTNRSSVFDVQITTSSGQLLVTVPTVEPGAQYDGLNRYYSLEYRTNLTDGTWEPVPDLSDVLATGQVLVCTNLTGSTNRFYHGKVRLAP